MFIVIFQIKEQETRDFILKIDNKVPDDKKKVEICYRLYTVI